MFVALGVRFSGVASGKHFSSCLFGVLVTTIGVISKAYGPSYIMLWPLSGMLRFGLGVI